MNSELSSRRPDFLMLMYGAMWDNINRHILVVWQSITALLAAVAALFLSGKAIIDPSVATAIIVLAATWVVAHAIDAKGWYNRNLFIISNIEKKFLLPEDEQDIHPFFVKGPRSNTMIEHLRIQASLGYAVGLLALAHHFTKQVWPSLGLRNSADFYLWLPYAATGVGALSLVRLSSSVRKGHEKLMWGDIEVLDSSPPTRDRSSPRR